MKRNHTQFRTTMGALLLAVLMFVAVSPAASAAGPLFHNRAYPEFRLQAALPEPTIEGLAAANAYDALLEKYGGFGVETFANSAYVDADSYSFFYGTDSFDFFCGAENAEDQPESAVLITGDDVFRLRTGENGIDEFGQDWTAVPGWEATERDLREEAMALDEEALLNMEILSVEDNGDGTRTLVLGEAGAEANLTAEVESAVAEADPAGVPATDAWGFDAAEPVPAYDDWSYGDGYAYDYGFDGWDEPDSWVYGDARGDNGWAYDDDWAYEDGWAYDDDWAYGDWDYYDDRYDDGGYDRFRDDGFRSGRRSDRWTDCTAEQDPWGAGSDLLLNEPEAWYDVPAAEAFPDNGLSTEPAEPAAALSGGEPALRTVLTVDAGTLEILKTEQILVSEDGTEELLMVQLMSFAEPDSFLYQEMKERTAPYLSGTLNNPRTVTVIYNPGTEAETVCTRMAEKGDLLYTTFAYGFELCTDEQGTPFTGSDGRSDVTIYAFPEGTVFDIPETASEEESVVPEMVTLPVPVITEEEAPEAELETVVLPVPVIEDSEPAAEEAAEEELPAVIVESSEYVSEGYDAEEMSANGEALKKETNPEEPQENADLSFEEVNRAIFEANRLETILNNHESVEYRQLFTEENAPEWPYYVYETSDMAYTETPTVSAYVGNGNYYELVENAAGSEFFYVFDFCHHYDPAANIGYEIVPQTYEEWWNESQETEAGCYVEGDEIHLLSAATPEGSREIVEQYLQMPYSGEMITSERVADAETFELHRFIFRMEKDGVITEPLIYEVEYDSPEPRACRNLRAFAERDAAQVATVRLVMNPGTAEEEEQTMVVPVGSNVVYFADGWMEMFEDPDCTVPAEQWDKMSDHTFYMRPSGENR